MQAHLVSFLTWDFMFNDFIFSWVLFWHSRDWNSIERLNSACTQFPEELQHTFIWNYWLSVLCFFYNQKLAFPLIVLSLFCTVIFYSYDHELVFGVSLKNMNKAERLTFGESLMTHAMTFTAVSEKVWPQHAYCSVFTDGPTFFFRLFMQQSFIRRVYDFC